MALVSSIILSGAIASLNSDRHKGLIRNLLVPENLPQAFDIPIFIVPEKSDASMVQLIFVFDTLSFGPLSAWHTYCSSEAICSAPNAADVVESVFRNEKWIACYLTLGNCIAI